MKYFHNMEPVEDDIERKIQVEEKFVSATKDSGVIYHFCEDEGEKLKGKEKCGKWVKNHMMLVSTLGAVIFGVVAGE